MSKGLYWLNSRAGAACQSANHADTGQAGIPGILPSHSLIVTKKSLFRDAGNCARKSSIPRSFVCGKWPGIWRKSRKFPVLSLLSGKLTPGDWFEIDCVRHHALFRTVRFPGDCQKACHWRAFAPASRSLAETISCATAISGGLSLGRGIPFPRCRSLLCWKLVPM